MILALTSDTLTPGQMYDAASTDPRAEARRRSQGVGQVNVGGSSLPAVRVELNPHALNKYGIGSRTCAPRSPRPTRTARRASLEDGEHHWQIYANDQAQKAAEYRPLIVAYRNGAPVRLGDVARRSIDSVQDLRNAGLANGKPAVL